MSKQKNREEQIRIEQYNKVCNEMLLQGYTKHNKTISVLKANVMALVTAGPVAFVCFVLYMLKWKVTSFTFTIWAPLVFLTISLICIFVHELLHGLTWALFCKDGWKSIHLGFMWRSLTPYCTCKEPLNFKSYLLGGLMPFFILGIVWFGVAYVRGNLLLLTLSLFNILAAGGDTTIALMLLKYRKACIIDHPTECGFVAFTK